jgi:hypothetical protein
MSINLEIITNRFKIKFYAKNFLQVLIPTKNELLMSILKDEYKIIFAE